MNTEALFNKATKQLNTAINKLNKTPRHKYSTKFELMSHSGHTGSNTITIKILPLNLIIDFSTQGKEHTFHDPLPLNDKLLTILNYQPR